MKHRTTKRKRMTNNESDDFTKQWLLSIGVEPVLRDAYVKEEPKFVTIFTFTHIGY